MSKRKLSSFEEDGAPAVQPTKRQQHTQQAVDAILSHGKTTLFKALKTARGFERQKLGRRQKDARARKDDEATSRLDGEVTALKNLDLAKASEIHLYKSLLKTMPAAEETSLPTYVTRTVKHASQLKHDDPAVANVTARLYNSNPTLTAIEETLKDVKKTLGIGDVKIKKKRLRKADYEKQSIVAAVEEAAKNSATKERDEDGAALANNVPNDGDDDASIGTEGMDEFELGNSDEESADEGGVRLNGRQSSFGSIPPGTEPTASVVDKAFPSHDQLAKEAPTRSSKSSAAATTTRPATTTFLPSLMGGYISGSDSDFSDAEAANIKLFKNRKGQMARRAEYEKKFGDKANHIKKAAESRDAGWDARKGAVDPGALRGKGGKPLRGRGTRSVGTGRGERPMGGRGASTGAKAQNVVRATNKSKETDGKLHPSWEAARKRKEQSLGGGQKAFEGKKIVFS